MSHFLYNVCLGRLPATYKILINTNARTLTLYKNGSWKKSYPVAVGKPFNANTKGYI